MKIFETDQVGSFVVSAPSVYPGVSQGIPTISRTSRHHPWKCFKIYLSSHIEGISYSQFHAVALRVLPPSILSEARHRQDLLGFWAVFVPQNAEI